MGRRAGQWPLCSYLLPFFCASNKPSKWFRHTELAFHSEHMAHAARSCWHSSHATERKLAPRSPESVPLKLPYGLLRGCCGTMCSNSSGSGLTLDGLVSSSSARSPGSSSGTGGTATCNQTLVSCDSQHTEHVQWIGRTLSCRGRLALFSVAPNCLSLSGSVSSFSLTFIWKTRVRHSSHSDRSSSMIS
eukprot:COSAG04_NODE_8089_length_1024_cov_1.939459_1_plen_189_part_00